MAQDIFWGYRLRILAQILFVPIENIRGSPQPLQAILCGPSPPFYPLPSHHTTKSLASIKRYKTKEV